MQFNVQRFKQALREQQLDIEDLAERMKKKHKRGSRDTIYGWTGRNGAANEELFSLAIDCLNEYTSEYGWTQKRFHPYTVDDFAK